jgi:NAD(P)H-hydrate epimerase
MSFNQIVSKEEMRQLDKLTMDNKKLSSFEVMYQAGEALFQYIYSNNLVNIDDSISIVAGNGRNGGDALVIGEKMIEAGFNPSFLIIGDSNEMCEESLQMCNRLSESGNDLYWVDDDGDDVFLNNVEESTVIIDGIFGTGVKNYVKGLYKVVIETINNSYARVISIDIPSGINANNGIKVGVSIKANDTLVIQHFKQGNLLNDALDYHGVIHIVDCGILSNYFPEKQEILELSYLNNRISKRIHNSYKYIYGNILTIGGSKGMMGAPLLSSYSALKTGSGLSSILIKDSHLRYFNNIYPELMFDTYMGLEDIPAQVKSKTCIIFGPGLGKNDAENLDILSYLLQTEIPLLIDADGIGYLKLLKKDYSNRENIIITPHYKEMADFLDLSVNEVALEPILISKNIAHKYNVTVVLKGACTIITNNIETYFSVNGNPGLATAGTGDILTGIMASFLGRGISPIESAKISVLIHSKCAKYAKDIYGEESMIASNIIEFLPRVISDSIR